MASKEIEVMRTLLMEAECSDEITIDHDGRTVDGQTEEYHWRLSIPLYGKGIRVLVFTVGSKVDRDLVSYQVKDRRALARLRAIFKADKSLEVERRQGLLSEWFSEWSARNS